MNWFENLVPGRVMAMSAAVKVTYCLGGIRVRDDSQPRVLFDIRVWMIYSQGCCCLGDMKVWDSSQP